MKTQSIIFSILAMIVLSVSNIYSQTVYTVTKTIDPDPFVYEYNYVDSLCDPEMLGTLQWAIRKTNDTPDDCVIEFDIPGAAPHEIALQNYLPAIENSVVIDATSQAGYTYDEKVITINGQNNIEYCFSLSNNEDIQIKGFYITGFLNTAISVGEGQNFEIAENHIMANNNVPGYFYAINIAGGNNTRIYGNEIENETIDSTNSTYGLFIRFTDNCIIGGPGVHQPNKITGMGTGITIVSLSFNKITRNKIFNNNTAINLWDGANNGIQAPEITDYSDYILSGKSAPNDTIEIFGSTGPQNANEYLISTTAATDSTWSVEVTTTYPYFIATATDVDGNTSEMSGVVENPEYEPYTSKLIDEICYAGEISQDIKLEAIGVDGAQSYIFRIEIIPQDGEAVVYNKNIYDKYFMLSELGDSIEDYSIVEVSVKPVIENVETHFGQACSFIYKYAQPRKHYADGKIIVRLKSDMDISYSDTTTVHPINEIDSLINKYGITKIKTLFKYMEDSSVHYPNVVHFDSVSQIESLMSGFRELSFTYNVERVPVYSYCVSPNDPYYSTQDLWHLSKINAESAWGIHQNATDVIVAILDNGFNTNHEDLVNNIWVNPGEIPNNNIDDDGNGYIDDIHGYDTGNDDGDPHINTDNGTNGYGHGTHVAGIAGAETNNNSGVASISYGTQLMLVKNGTDNGDFDHEHAVASLEYVYENNVEEDVVNMSWGVYEEELSQSDFDELHLAIQNLNSDGVILVAAAGNDGIELGNGVEQYPSGFDEVISVGATQSDDLLAIYAVNNTSFSSNYGSSIDVMAPGVDIMSTMSGAIESENDAYLSNSGTSMSSPLVAGLCALMRSYAPDASVEEIKTCLLSTCDPIDDLNDPEYQGLLGSGRINAFEALKCLMTDDQLAAHFTSSTQKACEGEPVSFFDESTGNPVSWEWTATPSNGVTFAPSNTSQNPDISFSEPGHYDITLTVINSNGDEQSVTYNDYIFVQNPQVEMVHSNHFCLDDGDVGFCPGGNVTTNSLDVCNGSTQTITLYFNNEPPFNAVVTDGVNTYDVSTNYFPCTDFPEYHYMAHLNVVVTEDNNTFTIESLEDNVCTLDAYDDASITFNVHDCCPNLISDGDFEGITEIPTDRTDLVLYPNMPNSFHNEYKILDLGPPYNYALIIDGPTQDQVENAGNTDEHLIWASEPMDVTANTDYIFSAENREGTYCFSYCTHFASRSSQQLKLSFKIINTITNNILLEKKVYFSSNLRSIAIVIAKAWMTNNFMWYSTDDQTVRLEIHQIEEFDEAFYDYTLDNISLRAINENDPLTASITDYNEASSPDVCDGTATVTADGGHGSYEYAWDDPAEQEVQEATNLCAGNYTVTVTDANACSVTASVFIDYQSNINVIVSGEDVTCYGDCDGSATVSASGGLEPYTYEWSNGLSTETVDNLCAGYYEVTVTDANEDSNVGNITIDQNDQISASIASTDISCFGYADGEATVTANGGTGTYTYEWSNGQTTITASDLDEGTYTVTVTDANDCQVETSVIIYEPNELFASTINTDVACFGNCNGSITVNASGGTSPYEYDIGNGYQTENIFDNLCADNYTITVQDDNGCAATADATINEPPVLNASISSSTISCFNSNNGSATVSASGGTGLYTYLWSDGQTTQTANNLEDATYNVTVFDGNLCEAYASVTINENPEVTASPVVNANVTCFGGSDGQATVTPGGGTASYTYLWSDGQDTPTAIDLSAVTYEVTVYDDHQCEGHTSVTITEPEELIITENHVNVDCYGNSTGEIEVTATGGTSPYNYTMNNDPVPDNGPYTNLTAGTYTIEVTDDNGCTDNMNITITEPDELIISEVTSSHVDVDCFGNATGELEVTATDGTTPYSYTLEGGASQESGLFTGLTAGTYTLEVTDDHGCTDNMTVTITEPNTLIISEVSASHVDVDCNGNANGELEVEAIDGTAPYEYTLNGGTAQSSGLFTDLTAGIYTLEVTDDNGCTDNMNITITQPDELTLSEIMENHVDVCQGSVGTGEFAVSATGGTPDYNYSISEGEEQSSGTFTGLAVGDYTVTATDANNCEVYTSVSISESPPIKPETDVTDVTCYGVCDGSISASGTTGGVPPYTFEWNDPDEQTTETAINLCAGDYTVTITDSDGCTATADATVHQNPLVTAAIDDYTSIICYGETGSATVTPGGGDGNYTYLWSNDETTPTATNLSQGTYYVTVYDGNDCEAYSEVTIEQNPELLAEITDFSDVTCFGNEDGSATVNIDGGTEPFTYLWDDPLEQTSATATGLSGGTYTVIVTDANNCEAEASVTITEPDELIALADYTEIDCYGETSNITITATGGTEPYSGTGTFSESADTYTYTVTDANGCTDDVTITITQPTELIANAGDDVTGCGSYSDRLGDIINGTANGGTPDYEYAWSPEEYLTGASGAHPVATIDETGVYTFTVTVTDANGCTATDEVTITVYDIPTVTAGSNSPICEGEDISLTETGGDAVSWEWSGPNSFSSTEQSPTISQATTDAFGYYFVTITDIHGCTSEDNVYVNLKPLPTASFTISGCPAAGIPLEITNTSTDAEDYTWTLSNEDQYTGENPEIILSEPGYYCIKLIITVLNLLVLMNVVLTCTHLKYL